MTVRLTRQGFDQLVQVHGGAYARDYALRNGTSLLTLRRWIASVAQPYYLEEGPYIKAIARLHGQKEGELTHWKSDNFPEAVKLLMRAQFDLWWASMGADRPCLRMSAPDYLAAEMRMQCTQANLAVNNTAYELMREMTAVYKLPCDKETRNRKPGE